jgi:hypothetical protein
LSAGALAGVAASLAYQSRQTRIATEETTWTAHRELLLLSLAKPEFLTCWEPPSVPAVSSSGYFTQPTLPDPPPVSPA